MGLDTQRVGLGWQPAGLIPGDPPNVCPPFLEPGAHRGGSREGTPPGPFPGEM